MFFKSGVSSAGAPSILARKWEMKNEVIFVSGQRGSGKTHWVKNFIRSQGRFLVYDALGEYEGIPRFEDEAALLDYCKANQGEGFFEAVLDPLDPTDELTFHFFCEIAATFKNLYVIIEEIDLHATPYSIPGQLQRLIKYGRHSGINILGVSRRPAEVSRLFTSQATRFVLFRQIEPRDITYFRSIIGSQAEMLPGLELYDFLDIDFSKTPDSTLPPQRLPAGPQTSKRVYTKA